MKSVRIFSAEEKESRLSAILSGILIAYAITCTILIGYAILITYASLTGQNMPLVVTVTCLASVITAGFDAAKGAESKGWLWGIAAGLVYAAILAVIGVWLNKGFVIDSRTVTLAILSVAGGGFGGVLGINVNILKKKSRR
ncbi:MAG: TIGR04086 family membrane protein [Clostridiales bacterium]|jgi:putative membrane protein (TIGR04086 family)|nr:TIGR04086 family membrane protein [Clostridiales bacterium]